jgi:hypothetical protein
LNAPPGNEAKPTTLQKVALWMHYVPGGALLFAVMPLLILGYFAWYYWGAKHLDQALYAVRLPNLECTPQPTWIRQSKVREEVFHSGGLGQLSLLDPQASVTIARAFESHSWVANVARVRKMSGGKVIVDVNYRRPIAMIWVDGKKNYGAQVSQDGQATKNGYYAVDEQAVILPTNDFDRDQVHNYFKVFADGADSPTVEGMSFTDTRIKHALVLCKFLESSRVALQLTRIHVVREEQWVSANPWLLYVSTADNRRILWGHTPGLEVVGEMPAQEKLLRLQKWRSEGSSALELDLCTQPGSVRPVHRPN